MRGRPAVSVGQILTSPLPEKEADGLKLAISCCVIQGRPATIILQSNREYISKIGHWTIKNVRPFEFSSIVKRHDA